MNLGKEQSMVLVFDVGATHIRIGLSDDGLELGEVTRLDSHNSVDGFTTFCEEVRRIAKQTKPGVAAGGLPGQIDRKSGVLSLAMNLTKWNGQNVMQALEEAAGCPVLLTNDVIMGGLGEAGAADVLTRGVVVYFTVSTGVNAVRLVDGWVDESIATFNVGQQLIPDAEGHLVTLESLTGGKAFLKRKQVSPREVRDGRSWRAEEHHLAHGVYNTILHWTPKAVVFGGSMMRDVDLVALREELQGLPPAFGQVPELRPAVLGDLAGLHGALAWARRKHP
jgi:predicted NBD/HSP70 family sugar kinase